jgi:hypothetical protein
MISYSQVLPRDLPNFYYDLLNYPNAKPANVGNSFYWDSVELGLKPTLRIVHVLTIRGDSPQELANVIAEKQLYSRQYFETPWTSLSVSGVVTIRKSPASIL